MMTTNNKKRKYVSDGLDVLQSFKALEDPSKPHTVHSLILGTLPSDKSFGNALTQKDIVLRGGDGPQNYGHSRNSFWNIIGSALDPGFQRHRLPFWEQVQMLNDHGYAVWDVLSEAKRKGSLDSNLIKGSMTPSDLPRFIVEHPNLNRFVFAANSAQVFCKKDVWGGWLDTGEAITNVDDNSGLMTRKGDVEFGKSIGDKDVEQQCEITVKTKFWIRDESLNPETFKLTNQIFGKKKTVSIIDDLVKVKAFKNIISEKNDSNNNEKIRLIELIAMPSTSPANARMRPPEKEKQWHKACFRLEEPVHNYVCPGCEYYRTSEIKSRETTDRLSSVVSSTKYDQIMKRHWLHDCPHQNNWKAAQKRNKRSPKITEVTANDIHPFDWYF